jgi:hypothetical protein
MFSGIKVTQQARKSFETNQSETCMISLGVTLEEAPSLISTELIIVLIDVKKA